MTSTHATQPTINPERLNGLTLDKGGHESPTHGLCLMEGARGLIRFRADGAPARGQASWIRVFGRCDLRGECWEFTGSVNEDGYGTVRHNGRMVGAHRVAWETANGQPTPTDLQVCHHCDNPPCVNPAHLFLGTNRDNVIDRQAKGRTKNLELGRAVLAAQRAGITRCANGHSYPENVRYRQNGARYCGECNRIRAAAYTIVNRDAVNARKCAARAAKRSK